MLKKIIMKKNWKINYDLQSKDYESFDFKTAEAIAEVVFKEHFFKYPNYIFEVHVHRYNDAISYYASPKLKDDSEFTTIDNA